MWQIKAFPKRHTQNDEQTLIEITSRFSRSQRLEVEVEVEVRDWQIKAFPKRHAQNDEQTLIEITSRFSRR